MLDTGIADHPDIASRLTADGFDFVSSLGNSGDGDGIDGDPTDPGDGSDNAQCGDSSEPRSSFHGTHVAGTIGASTNNRLGVAGVTWSPEIMDVRVLGCGGGSDWDVSQGILYLSLIHI